MGTPLTGEPVKRRHPTATASPTSSERPARWRPDMETAHVLARTPEDAALPAAAAGASFYISDAELDERPHHYVEQLRRQTPVWRRPLGRPDSPVSIYTIFPHDLAEGMFKDPRIRQFE